MPRCPGRLRTSGNRYPLARGFSLCPLPLKKVEWQHRDALLSAPASKLKFRLHPQLILLSKHSNGATDFQYFDLAGDAVVQISLQRCKSDRGTNERPDGYPYVAFEGVTVNRASNLQRMSVERLARTHGISTDPYAGGDTNGNVLFDLNYIPFRLSCK